MSFISDALGVVGKLAGKAIPGVSEAVSLLTGAIKKDPAIQQAIIDQEITFRKLAIQEGDNLRKMYGLEIQSEDKFVRRVRPAMLWLIVLILGTNFALLPVINILITIFGGFHDVIVDELIGGSLVTKVIQVANIPQIVPIYPDIPESLQAIMAVMFSVYTGARSWDKKNKLNGK